MLFIEQNNKGMGELMNLDLDYHNLSGFVDLSPLSIDLSQGEPSCADVAPTKAEEELTLLNISGNKPVMTTVNGALNTNTQNYTQNGIQTNPQNIDHLIKVIESQEKQNERMLIQFRLKQVLLDYLKTRSGPKPTQPSSTCAGTATGSPSLCQQQNQCIETEDQRLSIALSDCKNINGYPIGGQTPPPLLTPPISPDISQQFFLTNVEQKSAPNIPFIGLNCSRELIESQELSESMEKFYSSESEGQPNNQLAIDDEEDDFDDNNQSLFDETFDYQSTQSSTYPNSMAASSPVINSSNFNTTPIHVSQTKRSTAKSDYNNTKDNSRGRKRSTQSAPGDTNAQMQKRSAHLSAEFRYRTKLNDKITKLRNIVGPKSQLSKSGVLSRSIDLISKLQKSNIKLKEENKKIRLLLVQACNQLPTNVNQANVMMQ